MKIIALLLLIASITLFVLFRKSKKKGESLEEDKSDLQKKYDDVINKLKNLSIEFEKYSEIKSISEEVNRLEITREEFKEKFARAQEKYKELSRTIELYEVKLDSIDHGVYQPIFNYEDSETYKFELTEIKELQKDQIRDKVACVCPTEWEVGGSKAEGRKMTNRLIKLALRAFNGECNSLISKVKWNNITNFEERILKSYQAINKLNESNYITIEPGYLELKLQELRITHEYKVKLQEEKEEQKEIRERMREEEKARREYEQAQRQAEREELQYQKALEKAQRELSEAKDEELDGLNSEIAKLKLELEAAHDKRERALSMAQQTRRGHVYVISNIGSFGEDVFKIGMTRRLEPLDRVKELGDASVPFIFDVHAMIFSEDAPALEKELHAIFEHRRVNLINYRKEFFKVTLEEVQNEVFKIAGADIEFTKIAEAQDYRETLSKIELLKEKEKEEEKPEPVQDNLLEELDL